MSVGEISVREIVCSENYPSGNCLSGNCLRGKVRRETVLEPKRPTITFSGDFINRKGHFTLNCQTASDYSYHVFDVVIKWSGSVHDS